VFFMWVDTQSELKTLTYFYRSWVLAEKFWEHPHD
jgi:hypothetical protein